MTVDIAAPQAPGLAALAPGPRFRIRPLRPDRPLRGASHPSIRDAIAFLPHPAQTVWRVCRSEWRQLPLAQPQRRSDRDALEADKTRLRNASSALVATLVDGVTYRSHFGSRADTERRSQTCPDIEAFQRELIQRATAKLRTGPRLGDKTFYDPLDADSIKEGQCFDCADTPAEPTPVSLAARIAIDAAKDRARFTIGDGLFTVIEALAPLGLLDEAQVRRGPGQHRPERIRIRDAVFAAEDLTITDMANILAEWPRDRYEALAPYDDIPVIFIHCCDPRSDHDPNEVVLEAVDFGVPEHVHAVCNAERVLHGNAVARAQEILQGVRATFPTTRRRPM